jgi:thioredoxin 1
LQRSVNAGCAETRRKREKEQIYTMGQYTFEVTDDNFQTEVLKSETPVLVDFWAEWCGPCKMIAPLVDELAKKYEGKLRVGKMDVDAEPNVSQMYGVQGIPTLILFKNGQPVQQIVGYKTRDQLDNAISKHLVLEKA